MAPLLHPDAKTVMNLNKQPVQRVFSNSREACKRMLSVPRDIINFHMKTSPSQTEFSPPQAPSSQARSMDHAFNVGTSMTHCLSTGSPEGLNPCADVGDFVFAIHEISSQQGKV